MAWTSNFGLLNRVGIYNSILVVLFSLSKLILISLEKLPTVITLGVLGS